MSSSNYGSESSENSSGVAESDYVPAAVQDHIDQLTSALAQSQQQTRTAQKAAERLAMRLREKEMQLEEAEKLLRKLVRKRRSENAELREKADSIDWLKARVRLLERRLQAFNRYEEVAESANPAPVQRCPRRKRRFRSE